MTRSQYLYEVRPRKDQRGVDLVSDGLPFGRLCYGGPEAIDNAIGYAKFRNRSHDAPVSVDTKPHPMNILPQSMKRLFH